MKSPIATVKDKFGDKQKLVAAVEKFAEGDLWVSRTNKDKGLAHVSNAKLLRLHEIFSAVAAKFGTRAKLIDSILELEKRAKDEGYKAKISAYPVPRLFDLYRTLAKRTGAAPADKAAPKKAAPKKEAAPKKKAEAAPKKAPAKKAK